ncbi:hypothetical protein RFI_27310 [Reticulomyxa filosa]|uniref:Annexin n=1 Tax=Reticulomyxa filosa TaxID=46433 RepID=X6MAJ7_RETFI|nr:hypothetical protein RFI_27310 [Reticulomyxa filosa]|eukprot:ETO10065.1 hypothetical protein RFI_27310 [Reticulomyxa filosa]
MTSKNTECKMMTMVTLNKKQEKEIEKKCSIQPLDNYKPSLVPITTSYSDEDAFIDAMKLRKAMKAIGCDGTTISEITTSRSYDQRLKIKRMFAKVDGAESNERILLKDFYTELNGAFRDVILPLYSDPGSADAKWIRDAFTHPYHQYHDTPLFLEILCTRTNEQIKNLKEAWSRIDKNTTLIQKIKNETCKLFSNGHFRTFCTNILQENRPENVFVDNIAAMKDAELLYNTLVQDTNSKQKNHAKTILIDIFTQRSWKHIAVVSTIFNNLSNHHCTLCDAVQQQCGDCDTTKGILTILQFVTDPYYFWAKKVFIFFSKNNAFDLASILQVFDEKYGKEIIFKEWIQEYTKGYYYVILLKLCGY